MPYCTNCGEEVTPDQRFCSYCGEALSERETRDTRSRREDSGQDRAGEHSHGGQADRDDEWGETTEPRYGTEEQAGGGQSPRQPDHRGQEASDQLVARKNALETIIDSARWLFGVPVLIVAFFVVDLINSTAELLDPLFAAPLQLTGLVLGLVVGGVAYVYVDYEFREGTVEFGEALSEVAEQLLSLVGVFLIYIVVVTLGLVFFILPGIYLGARLILAFPACILDKYNTFESISVSWDVADGNVLKLIGIFLLSIIPILLVFLVGFDEAGLAILENPLFLLLVAPVSAIITGIIEMATARVYLENRAPQPPERAHEELTADQPEY